MINTKKTTKALVSLILIFTLISSIWIGLANAYIPGQSTVAARANYITFEGTAANDSYDSRQYSYTINQWAQETGLYANTIYSTWGSSNLNPGNVWFNASKSLRVGMTEFGEFADQGNTGIAYGANNAEFNATESWASTAINQAYMVQGWVLYMNYSRFYVQRIIEAYALYSNTSAVPETARQVVSWDGTVDPSVPTTITSGSLLVSGIQVLYDSARLGVARETTVIRDGFYAESVAQVTVTVIFDKTTKYAIVYYDVKILLDTKVLIAINDFIFQKKYEIDLARNVNPNNWSFVHYYSNYSQSVYQDPLRGTTGYDVVQAYDPNHQYIFFDGVYPTATEYSVSNSLVPTLAPTPPPSTTSTTLPLNTKVLVPGTAIADIPLPYGEPNTPVVTIQWNYTSVAFPHLTEFLTKAPNREIRFVDVYGMTDYQSLDPHKAIDAQDLSLSGINQISTEVLYLLHEVFTPIDLTTVQGSYMIGNAQFTGNSPLWIAVGQGSASTDNAGASALSAMWNWSMAPLGLFDTADSNHLGSIPYGIAVGANGSYAQYFSNLGALTGLDPTVYQKFGLIGFIFGKYDGVTLTPQPVSGGFSSGSNPYWYPAKSPLTERWTLSGSSTWTLNRYDNVTWNPNGIITVGGAQANAMTRYFNDFNFALERQGTSAAALISGVPQTVTGSAPTSMIGLSTFDFFPLSTWNTAGWNTNTQTSVPVNTFNYGSGYAIIALAIDNNGTRGISVAGWDARDTYWASAWTSQYLNNNTAAWIQPGTVAIILKMTYASATSEPTFTIVRDLGTITEFGTNFFATNFGGFDLTGVSAWSARESLTSPALLALPYTISGSSSNNVWWFGKLPTTSTALVDYDGPAQ